LLCLNTAYALTISFSFSTVDFFPSIVASAITEEISFIALIASSFPGIT